jgi:hypothetical protein
VRVTTVEAVVASQGGGRRRPWLAWLIGGLVVAALALWIGSWIWMTTWPPIRRGSVTAVIGQAEACDPSEFGSDETVDCQRVPFKAGAPVGIGFTVRNDAPVAVTVVSVEPIGFELTGPAVLHPELIDGYLFGADAGRPFEPVEVAPGAEQAIQLVGMFMDCRTVAANYVPGSSVVATGARMRIRWLLFESDVDIPLSLAVSIGVPEHCG